MALAAQKTLENVIGGLSIIFDKAVRVGDFLKLGETLGTVDYIGLRSTRIRTLDRTVLSVPNGQIANASIETLSARDKFWFHHFVGLRYETTAAQMRSVINGIHTYLATHPMVDRSEPIRARFFRFGPFSLDIEVFAYVYAGRLGSLSRNAAGIAARSHGHRRAGRGHDCAAVADAAPGRWTGAGAGSRPDRRGSIGRTRRRAIRVRSRHEHLTSARYRMHNRQVVANICKYQVHSKMVTNHAAARAENVMVARQLIVTWE